ncbi:hypothetical protein BGZ67_010686, partial [Mortierella alpina]
DISEARTTLKGLIDVQELQLRKLLAIKRHIQQNPSQVKKYQTRLPDMKRILDARSIKIKDVKSIISAYDAIRAESNKTDYASPNQQHRPQELTMTVKTTDTDRINNQRFSTSSATGHASEVQAESPTPSSFIDAFKRQVVPAINPEVLLHDARPQKIKDTQTIIRTCNAVQAEARNANDSHSGNNGETDGTAKSSNSAGRGYSQPAFLNIPTQWPRFRGTV